MSDWHHSDDLRALSRDLQPGETAIARVRARLARPPEPRRRVVPALALGLLLLALVFALRGPRGELALVSPERWSEAALAEGVALRFQGEGVAARDARAPVVRWEQGQIALAVQKGRGLALRVQTEEAEILVVGTRFAVGRDARGTLVSVEEGRVSVTCVDGAARFLVAGQRLVCPRSAAAVLAWAREWTREGGAPAETLELLGRGLARADADEAVRDELRFLEVGALEALGRPREARAVAEAALGGGASPRWRALAATAARLAVAEGDCAGALPHLRRLTAEQADPVALVMMADCLAPSRPEEARAALERALEAGLPAAQRAEVEARLAALAPP